MSEYTPTIAQVRQFWASDGALQPAAKSYDFEESAAEFDRFIEKVKAEAVRERDSRVRSGAMRVEVEIGSLRNTLEALSLCHHALDAASASGRIGPVWARDHDAIKELSKALEAYTKDEEWYGRGRVPK